MTGRLLVDLTPASGAHGGRGIGSYVRGLSAALAAAPADLRHSVGVLVEAQQAGPSGYEAARPWPIHRWRPQDIAWLTRWVADGVAMRQVGADAFHMTDPRAPLAAFGARRLVVTAYDLIPLEPDIRRSVRAHRRAIHGLYLGALRSADRVIAISSVTASAVIERLGLAPERVDVVYPVVERPQPVNSRQPDADPTFLFIGVPDRHKRPDLAVEAFGEFRRRHRAGRLRIIGPVAKVHVDRLRALTRAAGVEGAVSIEGSISAAALEAAFRSATALLSVSRIEGFGLPGVEAVLRGLPVVAVDTPIARETLGSAADFVAAESALIADAMERPTEVSSVARAELERRYSAAAVSESLRRSYEAALDE